MLTVLFSAPYMIPSLDRFRPVLEKHGLDLIVPQVVERLSEEELLDYAGKFDGTICGDDRYTARVLAACVPRLKVISKWGTGIDSIDQDAARRLGVQVCRTVNAFTLPVTDTVMGYMLSFVRRLPWMDRAVKIGHLGKNTRSLSQRVLPWRGRCGQYRQSRAAPGACFRDVFAGQRHPGNCAGLYR